MKNLHKLLWLVVMAGIALPASGARADLVTPSSVSIGFLNHGIVIGGVDYEAIPVVTNAYQGLGLVFPTQPDGGGVSLSSLGRVSVWSPIGPAPGITPPVDVFQYWRPLIGQFVSPGTLAPATVSSLSLEVMGGGMFAVTATNANGDPIAGERFPTGTGPHGGELFTFNQPGISGFDISRWGLPGMSGPRDYAPWGVSEVSFSPAATPEPGSLLLATLGGLGLAVHSWRRRSSAFTSALPASSL